VKQAFYVTLRISILKCMHETFAKFDADIRDVQPLFRCSESRPKFAAVRCNGEPNYDSRDVSPRDSHVAVSNTGVFVCYR